MGSSASTFVASYDLRHLDTISVRAHIIKLRNKEIEENEEFQTPPDNTYDYDSIMPSLNTPSDILTDSMLSALVRHLPLIMRIKQWNRLFTIDVDGVSIQTFFNYTNHHNSTLLIVKDSNDYVSFSLDILFIPFF